MKESDIFLSFLSQISDLLAFARRILERFVAAEREVAVKNLLNVEVETVNFLAFLNDKCSYKLFVCIDL